MNAGLHPTRGYVGGGNVAGILGVSPYKSPLDEYLLIVNEMQDELTPEKERFFKRRKALEPFAAECFQEATGVRIIRRNERYQDSEFPWMRAEIDFETEDGGGGETKTVNQNAVRDWGNADEGEEPPLYVTAQVMHGLGVTGKPFAYVHALIGLDDDRIYRIERDDALIAEIRRQARDFWRFYVEPRRFPAPTNVADLLRLYTTDTGRAVEADYPMRVALEELHQERQAVKLHEARKAEREFAIKAFMRDATTLLVAGQPAVTWKARSDGSRVFRIR